MHASEAGVDPAPRPVRVLNVQGPDAQIIRFLGPSKGGLLHWVRGRYHPCPGADACPKAFHMARTIWKAWAPAAHLDEATNLWWPIVLEITEHLDELLHGRILRGEVWAISRPGTGKKSDPLTGIFLMKNHEESLRPAFDVKPILLRCYHVQELLLGIPNPIPPRVVLPPSEGAIPEVLQLVEESASRPASAEEWSNFKKRLRGYTQPQATPSNNGHAD